MSPDRRPGAGKTTRRVPAGRAAAAAVLLLILAGAALLAACGGSSGGASSPAASATVAAPTPVPSPLVTSGQPPAAAVQMVRQFWTLAGDGRLEEAQHSLVAPGSPIQDWTGTDIAAARFVRVVPHSVGRAPADGATIEFAVVVWMRPGLAAQPVGRTRRAPALRARRAHVRRHVADVGQRHGSVSPARRPAAARRHDAGET